jgi:hypothetical protein
MSLFGLTALELALALAGFGAAVVALYLLKHRPRRVVVPTVALWEPLLGQKDAAALFRKLRRLWSLLLALLVLGLVLFAIADPRRETPAGSRAVMVLVDASASMAARDERPTRLDAAREKAREVLAALGPSDRAMIVQVDAQATALSPLSEDLVALGRALGDVQQTDLAGELEPAARLALDVLAGEREPELVIVSDGNLAGIDRAEKLLAARPALKVRYLRVGKSGRNLAITAFSVRRYPLDKTHHESIVTLQSFAPTDERVRLTVRAAGALLYDETLSVPKGGTITRTLTDLAGGDDALEARIEPLAGPDLLPRDDQAFATLPPRARTRILLVTGGNRYLEAALLLDEYLIVDEVAPAAYHGAGDHDVVIFDRLVPPSPPGAPALYLGPQPGGGALTVTGEIARPVFERVERDHPLVRLGAWSDVNAARATRITTLPGDHVVASSAEGAPLIVEGKRNGASFVALAIDVRESDLSLRAAWPLFLLGAVDRLAGEGQAGFEHGQAGDVIRVSLPEGESEAELVGDGGQREKLHAAAGTLRIVRDVAGLYTLEARGVSARLAINVPAAQEGALAPRPRVLRDAEAGSPARAAQSWVGERLWPLLVALALGLLALEWLTYHRRWTQ